ncbi:MAG TPA: EmrA/EmrK family multidrug efflux transporter periplasmic adaptor subunit, partial [Rhodocyclaceae bacterium]|nr:EmrA/EmrK family multidrug efflux transporter periplasmic adaptor subunit [Rhodocyclaceae bacterium]
MNNTKNPPAELNQKRRRALKILTFVLLAIALLALTYWAIWGSTRVSTDNAYVGGNVTQIS